jgi:hypothetical protein
VVANLIDTGPLGPTGPTFTTRFPPPIDPNDLFNRIKHFGFSDGTSSADAAAPPCTNQGPQASIGQIPEMTDYLHVYSNP